MLHLLGENFLLIRSIKGCGCWILFSVKAIIVSEQWCVTYLSNLICYLSNFPTPPTPPEVCELNTQGKWVKWIHVTGYYSKHQWINKSASNIHIRKFDFLIEVSTGDCLISLCWRGPVNTFIENLNKTSKPKFNNLF